jgi:hypothetical protein
MSRSAHLTVQLGGLLRHVIMVSVAPLYMNSALHPFNLFPFSTNRPVPQSLSTFEALTRSRFQEPYFPITFSEGLSSPNAYQYNNRSRSRGYHNWHMKYPERKWGFVTYHYTYYDKVRREFMIFVKARVKLTMEGEGAGDIYNGID